MTFFSLFVIPISIFGFFTWFKPDTDWFYDVWYRRWYGYTAIFNSSTGAWSVPTIPLSDVAIFGKYFDSITIWIGTRTLSIPFLGIITW
jgi:hypothetical protein